MSKTNAKTAPPAVEQPAPASAVTPFQETRLPTVYEGFEADANMGFENADADSYAIPFLIVLQSGSPQCKRSDGAYVEGAQEGMLYNTVTGKIIDPKDGVQIIPCTYNHSFVEWQLRENGGGFRGEHPAETPLRHQTTKDEKARDILPNGNQLNDTRTHYILVVGEDGIPAPAVISMSSTQIKKSKSWMAAMNGIKLVGKNGLYTPPMCSQVWEIKTKAESNDKGSWFGWHFSHLGQLEGPEDGRYKMAKEFAQLVASGGAKADLSKTGETASPAEPGSYDGDLGDEDAAF